MFSRSAVRHSEGDGNRQKVTRGKRIHRADDGPVGKCELATFVKLLVWKEKLGNNKRIEKMGKSTSCKESRAISLAGSALYALTVVFSLSVGCVLGGGGGVATQALTHLAGRPCASVADARFLISDLSLHLVAFAGTHCVRTCEDRKFSFCFFQYKKEHPEEAIQNEVVGQAHMEHYALQMFLYADNEDRAGRFGK